MHERSGEYQTLIRLTVVTDRLSNARIAGTLFGEDKPRLVEIKGIAVEADFAPHMLYVTNQDKPGFIGRFGMALADAGINIATFHLGRSAPGGDAICLVGARRPDAGWRAGRRARHCRWWCRRRRWPSDLPPLRGEPRMGLLREEPVPTPICASHRRALLHAVLATPLLA